MSAAVYAYVWWETTSSFDGGTRWVVDFHDGYTEDERTDVLDWCDRSLSTDDFDEEEEIEITSNFEVLL